MSELSSKRKRIPFVLIGKYNYIRRPIHPRSNLTEGNQGRKKERGLKEKKNYPRRYREIVYPF